MCDFDFGDFLWGYLVGSDQEKVPDEPELDKLTGKNKHIFLTVDGRRMIPDHIRKEVWMPALEKAGLEYRPPLQSRHTFTTMMISAGEDVSWVRNMLGHSSLKMIFQRYYAWMPRQTRSDGQAFMGHVKGVVPESPKNAQSTSMEKNRSKKRCTNLFPLDEYRRKKRA